MRIKHHRYFPAKLFSPRKALLMIQRIDRHRLACFTAGYQVVEIAIRVPCPYLLNDHTVTPCNFVAG
jgi:hypothetical protein